VPPDQEVDEEIAFHIEMRTCELVERGVEPKAAREIVLTRLGDLSRLRRTHAWTLAESESVRCA
jgi:hypothetical protein